MDFNDVREKYVSCPAFEGLDDISKALLLWRGLEKQVPAGSILYAEGDSLDNCFYLVLSGELVAEQHGKELGAITAGEIFGEMAFVNPLGARLATVRATSNTCSLLRFELTPAELSDPAFRSMREYFRSEAWSRFVSNAQAGD